MHLHCALATVQYFIVAAELTVDEMSFMYDPSSNITKERLSMPVKIHNPSPSKSMDVHRVLLAELLRFSLKLVSGVDGNAIGTKECNNAWSDCEVCDASIIW